MGTLIYLFCSVGAVYFGIGRAACPRAERLPLRELNKGDVVATVRRGWHALRRHSNLSRVMAEIRQEHR